jgi:hypothetical protein
MEESRCEINCSWIAVDRLHRSPPTSQHLSKLFLLTVLHVKPSKSIPQNCAGKRSNLYIIPVLNMIFARYFKYIYCMQLVKTRVQKNRHPEKLSQATESEPSFSKTPDSRV